MGNTDLKTIAWVFTGVMLIFTLPFSQAYTDDRDVYAINNLYVSLGSPPLPGWIPNGGDPCTENWQGVQCVISNITGITLNGANLGGQLGDKLENFTSIITIDLSNNHIEGSIPDNLPPTLRSFFLSANQFTGSIPSSLSTLTLLSDMSLNDNHLTGELPDAFQSLSGVINLDLSSNNLSGQLPPSMANLLSLTTLHMQNNEISGTLNVLQDLPLKDLNVENNLFSGPVPVKMLSIPNFKNDGNPFNTSIAPSPSAPPPPQPFSGAPISDTKPETPANGPSIQNSPNSVGTKKILTKTRIIGIGIAGGISLFIVVLVVIVLVSRCLKGKSEANKTAKRQQMGVYKAPKEKRNDIGSLIQPSSHMNNVPKEAAQRQKEDHGIDITGMNLIMRPPVENVIPKPHMPTEKARQPPVEKVIANPRMLTEKARRPPPQNLNPPTSVVPFTVASLQQYTNSFSQENLIGGGMLGNVYRAVLPDGKLLAIKKLDGAALMLKMDEEFLELVSSIAKLRHANVVELVGYCMEHSQRLLIYEYCSNGTLHNALHSNDDLSKKLSWNARIRVALGTARALEYLHEVCQPPVVHRNFKSANILLDDELSVRVSDCRLAPLISTGSVSQLSGRLLASFGYGAPEFESGTYTYKSDVYSFGVVMLELLTGRKSYDRSLPRGEQLLVRWAIPQLHDFDALSRMVDPSLNGSYPAKSLSRFADIISLCVQPEPEFRPPMSEIVQNILRMMQRGTPTKKRNGDSSC